MKYIFDFDDTLFHTTRSLRERIYDIYEKMGVSTEQIRAYVEKEKRNGFSLKKMLRHFSLHDDLHGEIMKENPAFVNKEILEFLKTLPNQDCFIVTCGDDEFQREKIKSAGLEPYFSEIIVVLGSKKEAVENICKRFPNEPVVFIDDRQHYFDDLDLKKYSNLKTVLYKGQNAQKLLQEINA